MSGGIKFHLFAITFGAAGWRPRFLINQNQHLTFLKRLLGESARKNGEKDGDSTPEFYEKYWSWLVGFAERLTGERQAAEDIAQETFLRAMVNLGVLAPLDDRGRRAWLKKTARNIFIDQRRRARTADVEVPERPFEEDFDRGAVLAEIGGLPDTERELFYLRYFAGFDSKELGRMFGLNPSTVRARLRSARARIKRNYFEE